MERQLGMADEGAVAADQMAEIDLELIRVLASLAVERQQATSGGEAITAACD
jgi:hypothetical protein